MNVVLIVHTAAERIGTVREDVAALTRLTRHHVVKIDNAVAASVSFALFDVMVLHYSLVIANPYYVSARLKEQIAKFRGLKILFIQDEMRWIDATAQAIADLGIGVVFSLVRPDLVRQVYRHPGLADVRFELTLTGFVPQGLVSSRVPEYPSRPVDVGYRARKLSPWYGAHSLQKWRIAEAFARDAGRLGLRLDISTREEDRIYGRRWTRFVANCKACLGTESGASVLDYSGGIQRDVEAYQVEHPDADFAALSERFFGEADGRVVISAISPRCFEAAALRTLMVMYPGEYNGLLEPGRHYALLRPDHANLEEVVETIRSPALARPIIERAYREIACSDSLSFAALGRHLDRVIDEEAGLARAHAPPPRAAGRARPGAPGLPWRLRLRSSAAGLVSRLRVALAVNAVRLERMALAAARRALPPRIFADIERRLRRLRRTARRVILGV